MRRLATLALAAAAVTASVVPAAADEHYERQCGGTVDLQCWEHSCRALDCFRYDCVVYVDVTHDGYTICVVDPLG